MSKKIEVCKTCNNELSSKAKICPQCGAKVKKPVYKKWWFWLAIVILLIAIVSGGGDDENTTEPSNTGTAVNDIVTVSKEATKNTTQLSFTIIAGEAGDYGKMITYNQGTEFEENFYAYYVPAGTYTVFNKGEYTTQINVYSDEKIITDEGWEEPKSVGTVKLIDVNMSDTIIVEKGQHIELAEPSILEFIQVTFADSDDTIELGEKDKSEKIDVKETTKKTDETKKSENVEKKTTVAMTKSKETLGQKNAKKSAESYLKYSAFSKEGLIEQLEYEQYSHEDAVYAVDNVDVDWNEQALKSAQSYLKYSAFSYEGLIDQLEYEGFTSSEAKYGADNCGADWNEQAAKSAESYLEYSSFSRAELIDQLEYEGFTHEQAVYGVEAVGY